MFIAHVKVVMTITIATNVSVVVVVPIVQVMLAISYARILFYFSAFHHSGKGSLFLEPW